MALDPRTIYRDHAARYHDLVLAEDCDHALLPALEALRPLSGARVLEVGAGTGRITRLLLEAGARVEAFDKEAAMLEVAREHLGAFEADRLTLGCADARSLPVDDAWADAAIAGWVFGHFRYWMPEHWREETTAALDELDRALVPGGVGIVIETLGTTETEPSPPGPLAEYYRWLETERGCTRASLRTDYRFPDVETAAETLGFFFGADLAARVRAAGSPRVPEVTGLWWWRKTRGKAS